MDPTERRAFGPYATSLRVGRWTLSRLPSPLREPWWRVARGCRPGIQPAHEHAAMAGWEMENPRVMAGEEWPERVSVARSVQHGARHDALLSAT
jgi:hypothetical protein